MASYWGNPDPYVPSYMATSKKKGFFTLPTNVGYAKWKATPQGQKALGLIKKKPKKMIYQHKGVDLVPLTPAVAATLDRADVIKYIHPTPKGSFFSYYKRRPVKLPEKPQIRGDKLHIKFSTWNSVDVPISHVALLERGDPNEYFFNQAVRYLPMNLKGFKRDLGDAIAAMKRKTDHYIERLPLHKKLELFRRLTPQEQLIYDFLYKGDVDELMKPDEEPDDGKGIPEE
jgi:hypothetical protein